MPCRGVCSTSATQFSMSLEERSSLGSAGVAGWRCAAARSVRPNSSASAFLFALRECNSMQTSRRPCLTMRSYTTESAAIFSAMNRTVFPSCTAAATMLAMVCDLPVPGGP